MKGMKNMKKILFALTIFIASFSFISCNRTEEETLVIWAWNQNVDILEDAVDRYKNEVDSSFNAEVVDFSKSDINTKITTAAILKDSTDMADIFLGDWIYMRSNYELFPELFATLSDDVSDSELLGFPDFAVEVVKNNEDELFALPFGIGPTVTFAYVPLFEELGYTQEDLEDIQNNGWIWDEYLSIGESLHELDDNYYMSAYNLSGDDRIFRTLSSQKGFWFMDKNQNVTIGNDTSQESLRKVYQMYQNNVIQHIDSGDYKSLMIDGKIAAQIQGFWLSGQLKSLAPEQAGDWMILPCPSWSETEKGDSVTGGSYLYVNNFSESKNEAIDFIKWETMNVENVIRTLEVGGIFPVLKDAYDDEGFLATDNFFGDHNYLLDVASIVTSAKPIYPSKYNGYNYDVYINAQYKVLFEDADIPTELSSTATLMINNKDE